MKDKLKRTFSKKLKYLPVRIYNHFALKIDGNPDLISDLQKLREEESNKVVSGIDKMELTPPKDNIKGKVCETVRKFSLEGIKQDKFKDFIMDCIGGCNEEGVYYNFPSGGDLRPLRFYFLIENVEAFKRDIYFYEIGSNSLIPQKVDPIILDGIVENFSQGGIIDHGGFYLLISANYYQSILKYSARGLRYIFMEAGHVMQNFYMISKKYSLGVTAIGGYPEELLNKLLNLDTVSESVIYCAAIGLTNDTTKN
ncbi:MAG: SagB family peptide dehydrogenase [Bacteriovoracaceae bacterium]|nr:SagB family peptide dehydrogenase [Bacteriovoracaceae bacterium]